MPHTYPIQGFWVNYHNLTDKQDSVSLSGYVLILNNTMSKCFFMFSIFLGLSFPASLTLEPDLFCSDTASA